MFHALKKGGMCVCRCPLFLKWPRLGRTGFLFLIVLSLKHFFILFIYFFFTKYHFSSHFFPYSTGVAHPQVGLGSGREWGYWSKKVQDVGEGSRFEHHESPAGAAGGRRRTGQARTYTGAQGGPRNGPPKEAGGIAWGCRRSGFPKKKKKRKNKKKKQNPKNE